MHFFYNLIVLIASVFIKLLAVFNPKLKLFVNGRKEVFPFLEKVIAEEDQVVWFHCASLGEFEQGRPLIEQLKKEFPSYKIVLTFFSPSGYELSKNYKHADVISYLPIDCVSNAKKFLKILHPSLAIFVKYEFWPNILRELNRSNIPTLLVSGIFRPNQVFFKFYGSWMRRLLRVFTHIFVQDRVSEELLKNIHLTDVTLAGDTRFDRVSAILERDNTLDFINEFKGNAHVLVAGSTWKDDEDLLASYINQKADNKEKFIIAPHNINRDSIKDLKNSFSKKTVLFSKKENVDLSQYQVFIIDTIGILTKIYSVAHLAYVGGGYTKSGIHNILEPATFGVPIIIGPNYAKFKEARDLIELKVCISVGNQEEFTNTLRQFKEEHTYRKTTGSTAQNYIKSNIGATEKVLRYLRSIL